MLTHGTEANAIHATAMAVSLVVHTDTHRGVTQRASGTATIVAIPNSTSIFMDTPRTRVSDRRVGRVGPRV